VTISSASVTLVVIACTPVLVLVIRDSVAKPPMAQRLTQI
jgi:hypothetical protein